ncbi:hypothetical protein DID76_03320 [Candidatus Marinamargulisbacteria bacterium SCGC AG-414-C22]|nr:hypothetical protein DID76_03320 [Candidatus Marinamargulisbacteria bacterium SCGC AG-414-C22]
MSVTIKKERRQSLSIQIDYEQGVIVKAPLHVSDHYIHTFINKKQRWIDRHLKKITDQKNDTQYIPFCHQKPLLYLGESYPITPYHHDKDPYFKVTDSEFQLFINQTKSVHDTVVSLLKEFAHIVLNDRITALSQQLNLFPKNVRIKSLRSRWGSCSSNNNINLNWKLIHAPLSVIDYVIVHELCHLVHLNHSTAFWSLVEQHLPHYKHEQKWLKNYGHFVSMKY